MNRDLTDRQYMAAFCAAFVLLVIVAYGVYRHLAGGQPMTAAEFAVSYATVAMSAVCVAAAAVTTVRRRAHNRYWSGCAT